VELIADEVRAQRAEAPANAVRHNTEVSYGVKTC
jgi:hypothetical protein